jgi:hypothetical protein
MSKLFGPHRNGLRPLALGMGSSLNLFGEVLNFLDMGLGLLNCPCHLGRGFLDIN